MSGIQLQVSAITRAVKFCLLTAAVGAAGTAAAADTTRVIVAFKPGSAANVKSAVAAARGNVKHEVFGMNAMAIEVPVQALKGLQNNPNVEYIEEDVLRKPFASGATPSTGTPYLSGQLVPYGIPMVQADQLPSGDANAANRKVCIIDSGYNRAHEDLDKSANVTGEYDRGTGWWYDDQDGHGTHVAGTIAALNNGGVGVVGVNPNGKLKLHIVKVFGADGWAYSSTLATAANKCGAAGANVISMSLGGGRSSKTEQRAFDSLQSKGVLSVAAAGNAGNTAISYPAGYASVMMVGALDEAKQWATFSQYNSKVEISGPGVNVLSTVPTGYAYYSGTSMATPHVSAVAALVWSYFPTCTGTQIRSTLIKSAQDLGTAGRDTRYGYGLVQAKAAYDRLNTYGCNN